MENTLERYIRHYPISWEQLHRDSKALAWKIHDVSASWAGIVAITRGGLVPAAIIARELNIHLVETVCIKSYDWQDQQNSVHILKSYEHTGEGMLIIDDLVDTGKTAGIVRSMLPRAHFATVYAKPSGKPMVDTYITEVSQDTWVLFPWDSESRFVEPIITKK